LRSGGQPASLEVHGRIASILAAMEAATILEKQFEALKQHDYLEKLRAGEIESKRCCGATGAEVDASSYFVSC
jgi:hypothetical protein